MKETGGRSDSITHHGNRPETVADLRAKEEAQFAALGDFLTAFQNTKEEGETRLDRSIVLYGTCMGSRNSYSNMHLPMLIAGDGFKHGQHLAFDHLHLSMLHRLSMEANAFSTSKSTMRGLELA